VFPSAGKPRQRSRRLNKPAARGDTAIVERQDGVGREHERHAWLAAVGQVSLFPMLAYSNSRVRRRTKDELAHSKWNQWKEEQSNFNSSGFPNTQRREQDSVYRRNHKTKKFCIHGQDVAPAMQESLQLLHTTAVLQFKRTSRCNVC